MEWADWKIRVNILSPGPFMSEMLAGAAARSELDYLDLVSGGTLLKRVADPPEIVGPVLLPRQRRVLLRDRPTTSRSPAG